MSARPTLLLTSGVPMLTLLLLAACGGSSIVVRNNEPVATFLSPLEGDPLVEGHPATLLGSVADLNDPAGSLIVNWLSGDEPLCAEAPVASDGTTRCEIDVTSAETALTLQVFDQHGAEGVATIDIDLRANEAPVVTVDAPAGGGPYPPGYVVFDAVVGDAEEAPEALALAWTDGDGEPLPLDTTVDSDGALSGAILLGAGTHFVTLSATDRTGATGSDTYTVVVTE